jgi:hypothetical protein
MQTDELFVSFQQPETTDKEELNRESHISIADALPSIDSKFDTFIAGTDSYQEGQSLGKINWGQNSRALDNLLTSHNTASYLTQHGGSTIDTYDDAMASKVARALGSEVRETLRTTKTKQ